MEDAQITAEILTTKLLLALDEIDFLRNTVAVVKKIFNRVQAENKK